MLFLSSFCHGCSVLCHMPTLMNCLSLYTIFPNKKKVKSENSQRIHFVIQYLFRYLFWHLFWHLSQYLSREKETARGAVSFSILLIDLNVKSLLSKSSSSICTKQEKSTVLQSKRNVLQRFIEHVLRIK